MSPIDDPRFAHVTTRLGTTQTSKSDELPRSGPLPRPVTVEGAAATLKVERIDRPNSDSGKTSLEVVTFETDEFTSVCPRTRQPDFSRVQIFYGPDRHLAESKALKYYLWAYRDEGGFAEALAMRICDDFYDAIEPLWVKVAVQQNVRGGLKLTAKAKRQRPSTFQREHQHRPDRF